MFSQEQRLDTERNLELLLHPLDIKSTLPLTTELDARLKALLESFPLPSNLFHAAIFLTSFDGLMFRLVSAHISEERIAELRNFVGLLISNNPPKGMAGNAAFLMETLVHPNLEKVRGGYQHFPGSDMRLDKGIICVPVLWWDKQNRICVAVISITSLRPDIFFDPIYESKTDAFAKENYNLILACYRIRLAIDNIGLYATSIIERDTNQPRNAQEDQVPVLGEFQWKFDDLAGYWGGLSPDQQTKAVEEIASSPLGNALMEKFRHDHELVLTQLLPPDRQQKSDMERDTPQLVEGQVNNPFQTAVREMVTELRSNNRIPETSHPTKFEQVITLMLNSPTGFVSFDELSPFFKDASDPDHARDVFIGRLNTKLEQYGYKLEKPRGYALTPSPLTSSGQS